MRGGGEGVGEEEGKGERGCMCACVHACLHACALMSVCLYVSLSHSPDPCTPRKAAKRRALGRAIMYSRMV